MARPQEDKPQEARPDISGCLLSSELPSQHARPTCLGQWVSRVCVTGEARHAATENWPPFPNPSHSLFVLAPTFVRKEFTAQAVIYYTIGCGSEGKGRLPGTYE
jgi:hypothetical protein